MTRPRYKDLEPGDFGSLRLTDYSWVSLKYDGLYAELVGGEHGWSIHGRNGRLIRFGEEPCPECYLRGEMIIDTEWAQGSHLYGSFVAWDCIYSGEEMPADVQRSNEFLERLASSIPLAVQFRVAESQAIISVATIEEMWRLGVLKSGWEGLVFRSDDGQRFARMKRTTTVDYVVTGVRRRGPCVTALYGGLYRAGRLETVCTVPVKAATEQHALGRAGELCGRVFEAKGHGRHRSGALRHPRQAGPDGSVRWRRDKPARECS